MDRRLFLAGSAALTAVAGSARAQVDDLRAAAREAWLYGLPLIETAGARARALGAPGAAQNSFVHARNLATPASRAVTTPNVDTLYSSAWLNLSAGAVTVTVPPTGQRYFTLALMDMYTNNFAVFGARTSGVDGGEFTLIAPPGHFAVGDVSLPRPRLPHLGQSVHAPGSWVWAMARTLVADDQDLAAAHAIQDGLAIRARSRVTTPVTPVRRDAAWNDYFFSVQQLIDENPPPLADADFFRRIAPIQLGMRDGFERARFADAEVADIEAGVSDARALLAGARGRANIIQGWVYPKEDLGDYGQDFVGRAATALGGLAALPRAEAMYMRAAAPDGSLLFSNAGLYRLSLPGPLPVDGFWSLTMYEATPEGQFFLTGNPIGRYAIGDRTSGLYRRENGAVDIWIGREDPGTHSANWLPAPARGPFALVMRAYLPKSDLLEGRYRLPPVEPVGGEFRNLGPAGDPPRRRRRR
ncbi:MAG: DUF1254 domain-containing protein [Caulobacterales bacterium]